MFQDAMLLKTQLFHSIWPNVDIIGYADYANSSADYSQGANGAYNYAPVSSESQVGSLRPASVHPPRCAVVP